MNIIVDLSYIHSEEKLKESVALYAFRFLQSLTIEERQSFTLLIVPSMEKLIISRIGNYKTRYFKDINPFFLKVPYVKGFLRKWNWVFQISKFKADEYNRIYLPFSWSGNSGKSRLPKTITIHDLRPMREPDRAFTNSYLYKILGFKRIYLSAIRKYYTSQMKNAAQIIAISEYVASEIRSEWPEYAAKVSTIYNSVSIRRVSPVEIKNLENHPFILYVNTLTKYKNIETLVRAFALLKKYRDNLKMTLVVVGKNTDYWINEIIPMLNEHNLDKDIFHISYAQNEELKWLYQNAKLFVTPSMHEGFGYTPIEAAIEGCPVISSRCESLPDVTGEMVKYYDPPTSAESLCGAIIQELDKPTSKFELKEISKFFEKRYDENNHKEKILNILRHTENDCAS